MAAVFGSDCRTNGEDANLRIKSSGESHEARGQDIAKSRAGPVSLLTSFVAQNLLL